MDRGVSVIQFNARGVRIECDKADGVAIGESGAFCDPHADYLLPLLCTHKAFGA